MNVNFNSFPGHKINRNFTIFAVAITKGGIKAHRELNFNFIAPDLNQAPYFDKPLTRIELDISQENQMALIDVSPIVYTLPRPVDAEGDQIFIKSY